MIYREYLVMRKAVAWFVGITAAIDLLAIVLPQRGIVKVEYSSIALTGCIFAALFAAIFGVALGNCSRGAARVLWVLPVERWKLALQLIAVDLAGVTTVFALVCGIDLALTMALVRPLQLTGSVDAADIAVILGLTYAIYGCCALAGIFFRRIPYGGFLATPVLIIWMMLAQSHRAIGAILRAPIVANPIAVFNTVMAIESRQEHGYAIDAVTASLQWLGTTWEAPVLIAIAIVTCAIAVAAWQRVEVIS